LDDLLVLLSLMPVNAIVAVPTPFCCYVDVAVKFGRMSKKQRERVEDEANFHKQQMNMLMDGSMPPPPVYNGDKSPSPTNNNNEGKLLQR
jgi:hypothetical protein